MWQSRRVDVNDALKEGGRGTDGLSKLRVGRLLVVLQVALSVLLLAGAGLCVKTFTNLRNIPLGFRAARAYCCSPWIRRDCAIRRSEFGPLLAAVAGAF